MSAPAVRIGAGEGVAVRTKDIIAWFVPLPGVEPATVVRALVLAAGAAPGLPVERLGELKESTPGLALAVVSLGQEFGRAWTCGDAVVTIDGPDDRREVKAAPGRIELQMFPLPRYAVRLGDTGVSDTWSHLIEGAVPAGGIAIVWDPSIHPQMPVRPVATAHGSGVPVAERADRGAPRFETVPLLSESPDGHEQRPAPLPLAGDEQADAGDEVEVAGLRCARGHFNHPHAANCAWCGLGMIQVSHVLVKRPRPSLGVLVVDGLATFTLDADYVLGRQPHVAPGVDGKRVREIVLSADRAISRAHAAIRLVDWDVMVEDLGSGIGTWVQQPAQLPFQLPPGQRVPLAPGAIVHLGPHRLTFHSHFLR
ncbi:FHA domain-containing protein [Granulicoccus sp. GXG6511]|uniref:FHA domain-containing protein n=1 Tax=Granulicoccus sp. GXG6511 TaxID=3381351 RepID=UPI003D7DD7B4